MTSQVYFKKLDSDIFLKKGLHNGFWKKALLKWEIYQLSMMGDMMLPVLPQYLRMWVWYCQFQLDKQIIIYDFLSDPYNLSTN